MRVFVQGATGVLGLSLVRQFSARGDEVVGLARSDEGAAKVKAAGGTPAKADIFNSEQLAEAGKGCDLFIQAATKVPVKVRIKPADFAENDRLRTEGATALLNAAIAANASHYLAESIVWVAQPADGKPFDEDAGVRNDPALSATRLGEMGTMECAKEAGIKAAILRMGWFYGPQSKHIRDFGAAAAKGKFPIIGPGTCPFSFLHTDDAAAAFAAASDAKAAGVFHVVDDERVALGDFISGLASRVGGRAPRHFPAWLARIVVGKYTVQFLTTPMITSNARFKAATKWTPRYPSIREGLDQVVGAWNQEGFSPK
jgi:nucleoside-diphosphate-sugar epimerase